VCDMMVTCSQPFVVTIAWLLAIDHFLELHDFDLVLIANASNLTEVWILHDRVSFSKEVVNQQCQLVTRVCGAGSHPESVDELVNCGWHRFVV
jgi:hypothetical protein